MPIAAGVLYPFFGLLLSPMIASLAMTFSSVSVILNGARRSLDARHAVSRSDRVNGRGASGTDIMRRLIVWQAESIVVDQEEDA